MRIINGLLSPCGRLQRLICLSIITAATVNNMIKMIKGMHWKKQKDLLVMFDFWQSNSVQRWLWLTSHQIHPYSPLEIRTHIRSNIKLNWRLHHVNILFIWRKRKPSMSGFTSYCKWPWCWWIKVHRRTMGSNNECECFSAVSSQKMLCFTSKLPLQTAQGTSKPSDFNVHACQMDFHTPRVCLCPSNCSNQRACARARVCEMQPRWMRIQLHIQVTSGMGRKGGKVGKLD